jgi:hypothetical protein
VDNTKKINFSSGFALQSFVSCLTKGFPLQSGSLSAENLYSTFIEAMI